jgi:hypothetical protein
MLIIQFHDDSFVSLISRRKKENEILILKNGIIRFSVSDRVNKIFCFFNSNTDYM